MVDTMAGAVAWAAEAQYHHTINRAATEVGCHGVPSDANGRQGTMREHCNTGPDNRGSGMADATATQSECGQYMEDWDGRRNGDTIGVWATDGGRVGRGVGQDDARMTEATSKRRKGVVGVCGHSREASTAC